MKIAIRQSISIGELFVLTIKFGIQIGIWAPRESIRVYWIISDRNQILKMEIRQPLVLRAADGRDDFLNFSHSKIILGNDIQGKDVLLVTGRLNRKSSLRKTSWPCSIWLPISRTSRVSQMSDQILIQVSRKSWFWEPFILIREHPVPSTQIFSCWLSLQFQKFHHIAI